MIVENRRTIMALLPIIYLSIAITAGLITTVVVISYISSKLRNRGNEDRILAIAYSGTPNSRVNQPKIVIHKKPLVRTAPKSHQEPVIRKRSKPVETTSSKTRYSRESTFDRARTTRVIPAGQHTQTREQDHSDNQDSYRVTSIENRTSTQKIAGRIEIVKSTSSTINNCPTSGHVKKEINNNDPLYYYSNTNDQDFYTIAAQ